MKLAVNLPQELVVDVGINLSGGNIGVPEQFLDHPQVGSVLEEVGGEGVAQQVRVAQYDARLRPLLLPGQLRI